MKLVTLVALSALIISPPVAKGSGRRGDSKAHSGHTRITRNEAQHLALHGYPGGRVTAADLDRSHGHPVWLIEITRPHAHHLVHLSIDANSGRILTRKNVTR